MTTSVPTKTSFLSLPTGENVFYRSAGDPKKPAILLLHGFPSSSHQYRNLIPLLSPHYHILAPDFPGFGFTTVPETFTYTFANLATTIHSFVQALQIQKYALYIFDYGAPVGLRLALKDPSAVTAIVTQNGNAYEEGFGAVWAPIKQYWASGSSEDRETIRGALLNLAMTKFQYENGTPEAKIGTIAPETYTLDQALMDRPGNAEIQLDLFYDYQNNVALYPDFQKFFRDSKVPVLATWGKNDVFFPPEGAQAYKKDAGGAEVHLLDAGHFAGETETEQIAELMKEFLGRKLV